VNHDAEQLLRYLDAEMSAAEAEQFRARLAETPALRQKLHEMQRVGALVRVWAEAAEQRAGKLVEPTLERVHAAQRRRAQHTALGYALAAVLVIALPWSRHAPQLAERLTPERPALPAAAAIERIDAVDKHAQVFVLGGSSTPVVWLADEAKDDDEAPEQDPG
jgi:hypothetical protein